MKNKKYLLVGAAVVLVIFILFVGLKSDKSYISEIERPDMGEDCTVYPLNMEIDGEEIEVEDLFMLTLARLIIIILDINEFLILDMIF